MCLAIPGKIISVDRSTEGLAMAKVDFGGILKDICIEWVDAEKEDYILAHAGVAITRIDMEEAIHTLQDFETIGKITKNNEFR
ncbi:HypC/HybG/HupF family hydrogenase formation chaperone [Coprobacter tertius]|uniref:HypC/HybG/HupF family hydrogenase formation chaperone n=1 Tax=Coprobacter tertius TaxID=2944915 RepID=A0ABT1MHK7_9BACT|nr:HypC/HybG/HupF family hydrogenase formation chaperone [Coprobacter tertius]MCP9612118.1 HypC/HybG/HupF family hydrogenase formation chaperone [Coprobacter tertius]